MIFISTQKQAPCHGGCHLALRCFYTRTDKLVTCTVFYLISGPVKCTCWRTKEKRSLVLLSTIIFALIISFVLMLFINGGTHLSCITGASCRWRPPLRHRQEGWEWEHTAMSVWKMCEEGAVKFQAGEPSATKLANTADQRRALTAVLTVTPSFFLSWAQILLLFNMSIRLQPSYQSCLF